MSSGFENNKGTDQPAHAHRLIRTFIIRFLQSIISKLAIRKLSLFLLVSVAEQAGLRLSETPKTGFLTMRHIRHTLEAQGTRIYNFVFELSAFPNCKDNGLRQQF